jgi:hypothetical protein
MLSIPGVDTGYCLLPYTYSGTAWWVQRDICYWNFVALHYSLCVCVGLWEQQTTSISRLEVFHRTLLSSRDYRDVTPRIPTYQQSSASMFKTWPNPHHLLLVGHSVLAFTDGTNRPYYLPIVLLSPHCVAFPMRIAANCSWSFVRCVIILCASLLPHVYCFTVCVLLSYILQLPDCWLEVGIRKVLRPANLAQVFLGFPVSVSKCWIGSQDTKLLLHASHVAPRLKFLRSVVHIYVHAL